MYSVLLVDDEPWAIEGLQMFVDWEGHGFSICGVCEDGAEALNAANKLMPDVIITDIRMPQMDGLELIKQLQGEQSSASEFVVLSAYSEFAYAKRAMQLGVHYYLLKPIIEEEIDEVLIQIRTKLDSEKTTRIAKHDHNKASLTALAMQQMKKVMQAIEETDLIVATKVIDSLFQEMDGQSLKWAELFACSLNVQCSKLIREAGGDPASLLGGSSNMPNLDTSELELIKVQMTAYVKQAIITIQSLRKHKPGSTLTDIERYVCENFRSPLSIREIASRFYLNPVYLGKAYQEKFGCSLLDRMHDLRILEACERLSSTNEPIAAIAEQLGYAQYHYFLRHFEQRTGMKPVEYRTSKQQR